MLLVPNISITLVGGAPMIAKRNLSLRIKKEIYDLGYCNNQEHHNFLIILRMLF